MNALLLVAIAVLLFLIVFLVAKANEYLGIMRGEKETRAQNNRLNAWMLLVFLIVGLIGAWWCNHTLYHKTLFPQGSASIEGERIDKMMWITIIITGIVFFITQILLFWFAFKYQEKEGRKAYFFPHNNKLEIIWTTIPALVLTVLIVLGLRDWYYITGDPPKGTKVVEITGHQFGWDMRYPGKDNVLGKINFKKYNQPAGNTLAVDFDDPASFDDIRTTKMVLPVNKPVKLVIHAQDVIHSVGLPHFRMKMDAVPGIPTTLWFTPKFTTAEMKEKTGNPNFTYEIACDQMCGKGHFSMRGVIEVVSEAEYNKWLGEQQPEYFTIFPDKAPKSDTATVTVAQANVADTAASN